MWQHQKCLVLLPGGNLSHQRKDAPPTFCCEWLLYFPEKVNLYDKRKLESYCERNCGPTDLLANLFSSLTHYNDQSVVVCAFNAVCTKVKWLLPLLHVLQGMGTVASSIFKIILVSVCLSIFIHLYSPLVCNLTVSWAIFLYPSLMCVHTGCICFNSFCLKVLHIPHILWN
jgi:hypothetical protein